MTCNTGSLEQFVVDCLQILGAVLVADVLKLLCFVLLVLMAVGLVWSLQRPQSPPPPMASVSPAQRLVTLEHAKAWFPEQCTGSCTPFTIVVAKGTPGTPAGTIVHVLSDADPIWDKYFPLEGGKAC